ncbi:MAG: hypothetical protein U9O85_11265 [Euryarchaeota archaeon]|nr:hypothetical protein [Euryarchaeota archaeon]
MEEVVPIIIPALIGAVVTFFLMYVREIYLYKRKFKREMQIALIEKRLEKLYSPLYRIIKTSERRLGKPMIGFGRRSDEKGEARQKLYLDQLIEDYFYLASNELQPYLAEIHGSGFYHPKMDPEKMINLIIKEYSELRNEYFACVGQ